jgi:hypothetical protein
MFCDQTECTQKLQKGQWQIHNDSQHLDVLQRIADCSWVRNPKSEMGCFVMAPFCEKQSEDLLKLCCAVLHAGQKTAQGVLAMLATGGVKS